MYPPYFYSTEYTGVKVALKEIDDCFSDFVETVDSQ